MHSGIRSWQNLLIYSYNAFSAPLLFRTLFSPWKRDKAEGSEFSFLEKFVFAIISRVIGFLARIFLILSSVVFSILIILTFPIFLILPIKISAEDLISWGTFGASLSYGNTYTLNAHSRDLVSSRDLKLFGKEKALRMIERGLSKDTNHNVLLVGDPGSGKSTLTEYLGRMARSGLAPLGIKNHRVVELFLEGLSLEDFDLCFKEASSAGNVILVIDNIHNYVSLYERLMPYLNTKELGIVVTTDFTNYDSVLKNYPEFLSKFEKVSVEPTSFEETVAILENQIRLHKTNIDQDAVSEIVRLAERFVGNQPEPLKSILILEELRALGKKITVLDVRQVVADKTNIPIGSLDRQESLILQSLENSMREKIIGQGEAVKDVCQALIRLRTGIKDPRRPAGSFLFLGPTGVGKTHTAKVLAQSYFGREEAMIRFDMTEFSLPDTVTYFIDRLASVVEEAPLSLVFFDELEKSNRVIQNLFLQILDEGRLTRQNGREVSFKDAIIIATSNAGSLEIIENRNINKKDLISRLIRNNVFAPEFLNRFSDVILFTSLSKEEIKEVAKLMLVDLKNRIYADKNIELVITEALIDKIAEAGFDPEFGARPIRRAIEEIVENEIATRILKGEVGKEIKIM